MKLIAPLRERVRRRPGLPLGPGVSLESRIGSLPLRETDGGRKGTVNWALFLPRRNLHPPRRGREKRSDDKFHDRRRQLSAASLGWNFVTAPLVGGALGYGLDWLIGTYPWAMIAGILLGVVAAFLDLIRSVR